MRRPSMNERGDDGRVVFGTVKREFSRHVHVDLARALQAPFQPLRRALMLDTLAGRVRRAANGAERLVEIGDRLRRQTASVLLNRARDAVDFRGIDRPPLAGAQSVGGGSLGGAKNERHNEHAAAHAMKIRSSHLSDIPDGKVVAGWMITVSSVPPEGRCPAPRHAEKSSDSRTVIA